MKLHIQKGTTSQTLLIFIQDSTSTSVSGLTGLTNASSGLSWYYYREGAGTGATQVTLAAQTLGTFTSGGFVEVDQTDMPGWYEVGVPDAALASGADFVGMQLKGATNMSPVNIEVQLTDIDLNDSVRAGLTAIPNVAAGGVGGIGDVTRISGDATAADNCELMFNGTGYAGGTTKLDVDVVSMGTDTITAAALAAAAVTEITDDIMAEVIESQGSYTVQQALSIILSVLAGETSGGGVNFLTPDGVSTRVAATVDASNNRTAMTLTPSS